MRIIASNSLRGFGILFLAFAFSFSSCKDATSDAKTEKKTEKIAADLTISENGLGELKIGMEIAEVEKVIGEKLVLLNKNPEVYADSAKTNYKGAPVSLFFDHVNQLSSIRFSDPKFKTASGIGVGSDKNDIWNAYNEGYSFRMSPDFEDTTYTTRSKTKYSISVSNLDGLASGDDVPVLLFSMLNGKVIEVEASRIFNDSE